MKRALPVIEMAEAPWTCRRIPILSYYNQLPDPAYACGNCDVCFAADPELPYTTNIKRNVEQIQGFFRGHRSAEVTRTALYTKVGRSQHSKRVVEYLVFKGILKESPYKDKDHHRLNCRLVMVASKNLQGSQGYLLIS